MITTIEQMYELVNRLSRSCRDVGSNDIAARLDDAMNLGSSGLEILGAIRNVLTEERARLHEVISKEEFQQAIAFVDRSFGRR